jgi:Tol biopolymer transport system component
VNLTAASEAPDFFPSWAPDGSRIAFTSYRDEIWVMPADGGPARQLTRHEGRDFVPAWSPDGRWIVFNSDRDGTYRLWRVSDGGEPEPLTKTPATGSCFSADGKRIYFVDEPGGNLWVLSLKDGSERRLTDFAEKRGEFGFSVATDGAHLYVIWVMDVVRE